ncbi:MAG: tRNA threonylcarbamoyladenosine dehydratase [Eubacteriales bacterium]|nr:tRNA threonylcarbamoyladenosine dehydratase [Eubacteriales bacterium]MDD3881438.1 tRNA threonylcarbamoyladenosine dehydratase [Eubacteriales bacterium]
MSEYSVRTAALIGEAAVERLKGCHVAVFGIGGVGSFAVEALARAGVGELSLFDGDVVEKSNINRQLIALRSTVGRHKAEVAKERIADIFPETLVHAYNLFVTPENIGEIDFSGFDYCLDAVDTVSAKLAIIERCSKSGVPVLSCMGAGNKLDAFAFKICPIEKTDTCPLARVMRRELKARGISGTEVIFSRELPVQTHGGETRASGRPAPASISFIPSVAGLEAGGYIVMSLIKDKPPAC